MGLSGSLQLGVVDLVLVRPERNTATHSGLRDALIDAFDEARDRGALHRSPRDEERTVQTLLSTREHGE